MSRKKILHLTSGLDVGGAEQILYQLVSSRSAVEYEHCVVSLSNSGFFGSLLERDGVPVICVEAVNSTSNVWTKGPLSIWRLCKLPFVIRRLQPDLIQTWMYPADLIGGLLGLFLRCPVVWGVFSGQTKRAFYKLKTYLLLRTCGFLAPLLPSAIISCSAFGRRSHTAIGYPPQKIIFIPTGFSIPERAKKDRSNQGSKPFRIGMLGRATREKRQDLLIRSLDFLDPSAPVELMLAGGTGISASNLELENLVSSVKQPHSVKLLGQVPDVGQFFNSLDLFVLISDSEGFPTVLGEAMAYGLPCLSSTVGDAQILLGDPVQLLPVNDPKVISEGIEFFRESAELADHCGARNQTRLQRLFSLEVMSRRYLRVYSKILNSRPIPPND